MPESKTIHIGRQLLADFNAAVGDNESANAVIRRFMRHYVNPETRVKLLTVFWEAEKPKTESEAE